MPSFTATIPNLQRSGPIVEVLIMPSRKLIEVLQNRNQQISQPVRVLAMIDTGATSSVVNSKIIQDLGLNPIGTVKINTPSSTGLTCYQYQAGIVFPNNIVVETDELIEVPLQEQNIQCLIGRDVLKFGVLIYNGYTQTITFSL
ncbi:MAG TPA: hypothetical protein PLF61_05555 [Candidatus Goldiibacteriota bacterium]|nr:hypothetical protein [Candidatus Goldiibacteriota bacterium]